METARRRLRGPARAYVAAGAPGTGKSAFGAALSHRTGAAPLDQDVLTGPLTAVAAELIGADPGDLDDPRVRLATRAATCDSLTGTAAGCVSPACRRCWAPPPPPSRPVGPCGQGWSRAWARRAECCWSGPPAGRGRWPAGCTRAAPRDGRELADLDGFLRSGVRTPPVVPHVAVHTTAPAATQLAAVLGRQPAPVDPDSQPGGPVRHH